MTLPASIISEKVVPVARGLDSATAPPLLKALQAGGLSTIEITVEGDAGFDAVASVANSGATVGAGTIVSVSQAERAFDAGAMFGVSPHFDEALLDWATTQRVLLIPGALTPTEIARAWHSRPPAVKVFPASVGGPGYIKSLLGPYPDLALLPTGGIDADNVADYMRAGAVAVGVGSWLTSHDDLDLVTERAAMLRSRVV